MNNLGPLTPEYVAGLTDGEGCFELGIIRNMAGHRYGWTPRPRFSLCQFGALPSVIESELEQARPNVDDYPVPKAEEAEELDDPLYDSGRDYREQLDRYKAFQQQTA